MDFFGDGVSVPTKDFSWVNPETDPPSRNALGNTSDMGFMSATNVENEPTSDKLIEREWIDAIP